MDRRENEIIGQEDYKHILPEEAHVSCLFLRPLAPAVEQDSLQM